jgi:DeoR/GlpR family transcriptional regulator of sugar metabolism
MIDSSQKVVCCTISEKINTLQPIHICNIADIDILITELPPDAPILRPYVDAGIQVL